MRPPTRDPGIIYADSNRSTCDPLLQREVRKERQRHVSRTALLISRLPATRRHSSASAILLRGAVSLWSPTCAGAATRAVRLSPIATRAATATMQSTKLLDVWPDGYAQRLCDGMVRARFREGMEHPSPIEPGRVYAYDINFWNTCQVLKKDTGSASRSPRAGFRNTIAIRTRARPWANRPKCGQPNKRFTTTGIIHRICSCRSCRPNPDRGAACRRFFGDSVAPAGTGA